MIDYHKKQGISAHGINLFIRSGPKAFKLYYDGQLEVESKSSQIFGTALHKYCLENEDFLGKYHLVDEGITVPAGKMGKLMSKTTLDDINIEEAIKLCGIKWGTDRVEKELKKLENVEYIKLLNESKNKTLLSFDDYNVIRKISYNISQHKTANRIIYEKISNFSLREVEVFWKNHLNQDCKAMIDILNIFPDKRLIEIGEIKSTSKPVENFEWEIKKYSYHRQLSWYIYEAIPQLLKQYDLDSNEFRINNRIIVCSTIYPHSVRVIELDEVDLIEGQRQYSYAIDEIKWHMDNDWWDKKLYKDQEDWIDHVSIFSNYLNEEII